MMDARSRKFEKFNLKNLLLFSMLIILFSECKNSESKIVVNETKISDTIHIDREYNYFTDKLEDKKNLVQFIDNPKLMKAIAKDIWEVVEKGEAPEEETASEDGDEVPPPTEE